MTRRNGARRGDRAGGGSSLALPGVAARVTAVLDRCRSELQSLEAGAAGPNAPGQKPPHNIEPNSTGETVMDNPGPEIAWMRAEAKRARERARAVGGALRAVAEEVSNGPLMTISFAPMRKAVIIGASVLVIGMCLFPPYTVEARYPASGETKTETQYAAVWEGPQDRGQYRLVDESSIDTAWLGIQLAIVVACGVVGVVAVPEE